MDRADASIQDVPTPEEIENVSFPESQHGYDRLRVDAFVRTIALAMRRLQRDLEIAVARSEAPYRAAGKEIGDLLQDAKERSHSVLQDAQRSAARTLQEAHRESQRLTHEAESVEREARRAADRLLSEARAEAAELVERARRLRSRADAEARITIQEAERDARRTKQEAKAATARLREEAERDHAEVVERLKRRIGTLRDAEIALRQRVAALKAETGDRAPRPEGETGDVTPGRAASIAQPKPKPG